MRSKIATPLANYQKLNILLKLVADICNVKVSELKGKGRQREIVDSRRIFAVLARKYFEFTLNEIGAYVNKGHATILHHLKTHSALMECDEVYNHFYQLCHHTVAETDIIQNDDKINFIDALVAENRLLQTEVDVLSKTITNIKNELNETNEESST